METNLVGVWKGQRVKVGVKGRLKDKYEYFISVLLFTWSMILIFDVCMWSMILAYDDGKWFMILIYDGCVLI